MKKTMSVLLAAVMLCGCSGTGSSSAAPSSSSSAPEPGENVKLNTVELDMDGYYFLEDKDPAFIQVTTEESFRIFDEKGTYIILYSYDTCFWCNRGVPVLNDAAKEEGIKVVYVNVYEDAFTTLPKEERMRIYNSMIAHLEPALDLEYNQETGKMEPAMYTPLVVAVKNGEIVDHHTALVESFEPVDDSSVLNDEQKEELKNIYKRVIESIQ